MIEGCLRGLATAMPGAEILVVHGGSDNTMDIAASLRAEFPGIRAVKNPDDRGKGHAVKTGIAAASHDVIAQFDADMQFYPEDVPLMVAPVLEGRADLCIGSRFMADSTTSADSAVVTRDLGNKFLSAYASLLAGRRFSDVTTGMKVWTRDAIRRIDFRDDRYSYEVELLVRAAVLGLRTLDVPIRYRARHTGVSMHRNNLAVAKAGMVILAKTTAARLRKA